ncbi:MAG: hypothetical protein QX189_04850 [Methylococcales bacterium]
MRLSQNWSWNNGAVSFAKDSPEFSAVWAYTPFNDGVSIEVIARVLNHSNTTSTLRYLGFTQEEVMKTYDDYEL